MVTSARGSVAIVESGRFFDRELDFSLASREVCMSTGEVAHSVLNLVPAVNQPREKKADELTNGLTKLINKVKRSEMYRRGTIVAAGAGTAGQGGTVQGKIGDLHYCRFRGTRQQPSISCRGPEGPTRGTLGGPYMRAPFDGVRVPAESHHPYKRLTPDTVLSALESLGLETDGRMLALNSYENRVYQIGLEDGSFVVVKFYRPGRWSDQAIWEEHSFSRELAKREIPVVPPMVFGEGETTLNEYGGFRFAVFPRRGGRWPELDDPEVLLRLGRFLGRIHALGATRPFAHRPTLDSGYGEAAYRFILERGLVPPEYAGQYGDLGRKVLDRVGESLKQAGYYTLIRLHGDFHPGNILWTQNDGAHLVDMDDCRNGPAVQDLWMLLSGERHERIIQLSDLLEGYEEFFDLDRRELRLIEPLRALRIIHYAGWLARRWTDPAFPRAFPWFNTLRYWEEQVLTLRQLLQDLDQPPLSIG